MRRQTLSIIAMALVLIYFPLFTLLDICTHLIWGKEIDLPYGMFEYTFLGLVVLFFIGLITVKLSLCEKLAILIFAPIFFFVGFMVCGWALIYFTGFPPQN